jgi:gp16 family phage-associated protein
VKFKEIKKWLIDQGLTQTEIAKQLGISQTAVYQVIKGNMRSKRITALLKELGCPNEYLEKEVA